jgi:small subunit ribosomal protein S6
LRFYETTVVLSPTSDEAATQHEIEKITQTVTGGSGTIVATQRWGTKRMAYPIQKHAQAQYIHFVYQAPPAVPAKLESMFRINENILRHLTVLVEGPLTPRRYGEGAGAEGAREGASEAVQERVAEAASAADAGDEA